MTRQDSESYHVRLNPEPPLLIKTSDRIGDRFDCSELYHFAEAGLYRRVSKEFIAGIRKEQQRQKPGTERWERLAAIITLAESAPVIAETDLGNSPEPPHFCP